MLSTLRLPSVREASRRSSHDVVFESPFSARGFSLTGYKATLCASDRRAGRLRDLHNIALHEVTCREERLGCGVC